MKTKTPLLKITICAAAIVALAASFIHVHASAKSKAEAAPIAAPAMLPAMDTIDKATLVAKEAAVAEAQRASAAADRQAALQRSANGTIYRSSKVPRLPSVTCGAGNVRVEATNSGNDADYTDLASAFAAINAGTHTGIIDVGVCADTAEPAGGAVLNASGGTSSYTSVLIRPTGARTVSGAATAGLPLIDLNGADAVTIDGLNATGNSLTISNTTVSATASTSTIRMINGASGNTVTNCAVLGSSTASVTTAGGTILISTSTGGANDSNTISNNAIGPAGANLPSKGVMSLGSASPNHNTGTIIDNNNVFDFFTPGASCAGIDLQSNTATTTVSNNRIFQTAPRVFTASATYSGILMTSSGNSATITGNTIGFGAANGTGTTTISGSTNLFIGLNLTNVSATTATSVQNNTISGINQTTSSTSSSLFRGMSLGATTGRFDVGTTTGNKIGSLDGSSTIVVNATSTVAGSLVTGIFDNSFVSGNSVNNNEIGAITINSGGTGTTTGFRGILVSQTAGVAETVNNNTIGGAGAGAITDNIVGNYGMYAIASASTNLTAFGNLVRNMNGNSNGGVVVMGGIVQLSAGNGAAPNVISKNTVHSLSNTVTGGAAGAIYVLDLSFPVNAANVVEQNFVHSVSVTSTLTAYQIRGILRRTLGTASVRNNMVRLGIDAAGSSITTGFEIIGIVDSSGSTSANNYFYNSVYIGGSGVVSASNTFAFVSSVVTNARQFKNNIFWNARDNASGTGKNYAISLAGTAPNPAGLTSDFNDLYATGTGGFVGLYNTVDQLTLADWQLATGQDANSKSVDPLFVNATGNAATVDLHLMAGSPMIAMGTPIAGITLDFDKELRNPCTPDIGADEFTNYTGPAVANVTITKTADAATVVFGSQIGFTVRLNNTSSTAATGLTFTDTLPAAPGVNWTIDAGATDPGWSVVGAPPTQSLQYGPTTLAGNTLTQAHVVSTTTSATCGSTLTNQASFTISNGCPGASSGSASASVNVVGTFVGILSENFDAETPPALPAGWIAANASGPAPLWVTSNAGTPTPVADSAPNAAFVDDPAVVSDKRLDSPSIAIATASAQLTFRRNHVLEAGTLPNTFDGGVLEISIGGGAFTDIITAGGSFVTGGYNAVVNAGFMNPLAGRAAWGGSTGGAFVTTTVNLPAAAAGQSIVLRWRMGSDNGFSAAGWRIDNVVVSEPGACPPPPVTATDAVSRVVHGGAGPFDIDLPFGPISGPVGIESRSTGGAYQIVFSFANDVTVSGSTTPPPTAATVSPGTGTVSSITVDNSGAVNFVTVNLTGVANVQRITVTLLSVSDGMSTNDVEVSMGVLVADAVPDGSVNSTDVSQVKFDSGSAVDGITFRSDVNANGAINSTDVSLTKLQSGTALPP